MAQASLIATITSAVSELINQNIIVPSVSKYPAGQADVRDGDCERPLPASAGPIVLLRLVLLCNGTAMTEPRVGERLRRCLGGAERRSVPPYCAIPPLVRAAATVCSMTSS